MEKTEFEAVKYISAGKVKNVIKKFDFKVERSAMEVIDKSKDTDILSIKLTINSPLVIVRAANVTSNPNALFEVAETR